MSDTLTPVPTGALVQPGGSMSDVSTIFDDANGLPVWLPAAVQNYIFHTIWGRSIRTLAKAAGCHASTVLRQVRKIEARRDDPLIDEALTRLGSYPCTSGSLPEQPKDFDNMNIQTNTPIMTPDRENIEREGRRILRRLCEPRACLAVAKDMENAVVVREADDGSTVRTAVVERSIAQAMALKDWITCAEPGRISRYAITGAGRAALKRLLAEDTALKAGMAEAPGRFADQHRCIEDRDINVGSAGTKRRVKYNYSESPVLALSRRRDQSGELFLTNDLVRAAERLREDFELAQMGPRTTQNWDHFLTAGSGGAADSGVGDGPSSARKRVGEALSDLGPGLGDVALRVCCFLEGLEAAEKRMGWSARSGKIVLRIALQRLRAHYDGNAESAMIG